MNIKLFTVITKIVFSASVLAFAIPAFSTTVDFNTSGVFTCGTVVANNPSKPGEPSTCSTSLGGSEITISNDGNTITIQALGDSYTNFVATSGPAGDVNVVTLNDTSTNNSTVTYCTVSPINGQCKAPGTLKTVTAGAVGITGAGFTLNIDQTVCHGCAWTGKGSIVDGLSGGVFYKNTNAFVQFEGAGPSVSIGQVTYTLDQSNYPLANPGKITNLPGYGSETFTAQVTPEPTFLMLTGLGLAGLMFVAYRRRQTVQASDPDETN